MKKSPLYAALLAHRKASMLQGDEYVAEIQRDFAFSESELKKLAVLVSFGRTDEFKREA